MAAAEQARASPVGAVAPVPLHLVRPAALTVGQAFLRAVAVVDRSGLAPVVEEALASQTGRRRELPGRALLIGLTWHAISTGANMHLTGVAALLGGANDEQAQVLGTHRPVSYRQVEDTFGKLVQAVLVGLVVPHDHAVADLVTGEIVPCPGRAGGCRSEELTLDDVAARLLAASLPLSVGPTGVLAVDSTDYETWGCRQSWTTSPDALPVKPSPSDSSSRVQRRKALLTDRRGWPLRGQDGRWQHTKDPDARAGHRSGSNGSRGEVFVGYDLHTLVDVPVFGGDPVPHVIRAIALRPGGEHKGAAGIDALDAAIRSGHGVGLQVDELLADRGYTYCRTETFALPLMARRVELVLDLHSQQRGQLPGPVPGTVWVDGALFSTALPDALRQLEPTRLGMTKAEKAQRREEFDRRQPYAFRAHGRLDPEFGTQRRKGPALAGIVRCPNVAASLRLALALPTTSCVAGSACGCGLTITIGPEEHGRERQRLLWGTTRWAASYGRRTGVESSNAEIKKNHAVMDRGYTRVFGLAKNTLLLAFGLAGVNIRLLRHWHARRGQPDPWASELGESNDLPALPEQRASRPVRRPSLHQLISRRGPPGQEHHP